MDWLPNLTPGQGSMISGFFTACGAVLGIVIAAVFFSGKVKTLKEALDESQKLLSDHVNAVRGRLSEVTAQIEQLSVQSSGLASGVGRIEAEIVELNEPTEPAPEGDKRERLRKDWILVRDELEKRASSEDIDGRTRAAYGRVDRRSYYDLIRKMEEGGTLPPQQAKDARRAYELWQRYKNGKTDVPEQDLNSMTAIRHRVVAA